MNEDDVHALVISVLDATAALAGQISLQLDAAKLRRDLQFASEHYAQDNPGSAEAIQRLIDAIGAARPREGSHESH